MRGERRNRRTSMFLSYLSGISHKFRTQRSNTQKKRKKNLSELVWQASANAVNWPNILIICLLPVPLRSIHVCVCELLSFSKASIGELTISSLHVFPAPPELSLYTLTLNSANAILFQFLSLCLCARPLIPDRFWLMNQQMSEWAYYLWMQKSRDELKRCMYATL